jgi:hypothetical protein
MDNNRNSVHTLSHLSHITPVIISIISNFNILLSQLSHFSLKVWNPMTNLSTHSSLLTNEFEFSYRTEIYVREAPEAS